ncbi:LysR family transcriptional regulator [Paenibacillus terricola]|nr:LysR family transcriptional regulator [Paenibacillus terricola]
MKSSFRTPAIEVIYIKSIMNMEWYRIFLHTARAGNLTHAAQELHITQPSVSYAIKQLEDSLGVKLFDRQSKGVALTSEGRMLLDYVEKSFLLLDNGEKQIASLRNYESGELRIGASGPIIKHLLLPPLDELRAQHPNVRIRLFQGNTADTRTRLVEGQIDLGFVHLPYVDPELEIKPLTAIQGCFVVGPAYKELASQPITPEELNKLPLLLLSRGSHTRQFIERWFAEQGITAEVDMELNSSEMLVELARHGYGAAYVTRSFVQHELREEALFELTTTAPIAERFIGVATRNNASLSLIADYYMGLLSSTSR